MDVRAEVPKYVCRAGAKLEKALDMFEVDVSGCVALDAGLSTGGFTDCLLQRGATQVRCLSWCLPASRATGKSQAVARTEVCSKDRSCHARFEEINVLG